MSIIRSLTAQQRELSYAFDERFISAPFRLDGHDDFTEAFMPPYLSPGLVVYEIGGGKQPLIPVEKKRGLGVKVIGLDIDAGELARAPAGAYDRIICADIQKYRGAEDADVAICHAVLEHVACQRAAIEGVFSVLKPGGLALVWVPSRNACYARLNLLLPERLKRAILFYLYPPAEKEQGFKAYYDCCTPRQFRALAGERQAAVIDERYYFRSSNFTCLFPMFVLWRLWVYAFHFLAGEQACESFSFAIRKRSAPR
jgi:SAM-dependent methyltransferase